jgi:aminoglycoside phosphotransferase (APT) family kinase protein
VNDRLADYLTVLADDGHSLSGQAATLRSGQFHDVVLAGDVAYRFPRDEESRRRLPERAALLSALARCSLPVTIPEPVDTGHLDRPLGSCYLAVRRVPGEPARLGMVTGEVAVSALVTRVGELLDVLAALGAADEVRRVVPRTPPDYWLDWGEQVRRLLFPLMSVAGRRRAEGELAAVARMPASGDQLVHSDLGGENLLLTRFDGVPALTGVLDWDEARIGHQANDLASLAVTFGWPVAERIEAGCQRGATDRSMIGAARHIAATFALQQALPAVLSGDQESLNDGLSGYR